MMTPEERKKRIDLFLSLIEQVPLGDSIDELYKIVCKFDTPAQSDRDFVYECLITHYQNIEEYEKCAKLFKLQKNKRRKVKITSRGLTIADLMRLQTLRYNIPDEVVVEVLINQKKRQSK